MNEQTDVSRHEADETEASWNQIAEGYDEFVTPTHMALAMEGLERAGVEPGDRFLDVAAGSGALSIPAARLGAKVVATDISPVMIERLENRARSEGLELQTAVMDGHALDLESDFFDVTGSQFGVMLFPDMPRGIAEMARVTRPGGRVLMIVFGAPQQVEFLQFLIRAIQTQVPGFEGPPMDPGPLPFQLRDPDRLRDELNNAGLRNIDIHTTTERLEFENGRQLWNWLTRSNPIVEGVLAELSLSLEQRQAVQDALEKMVRDRAAGGDRAILTNPINIGVGIK